MSVYGRRKGVLDFDRVDGAPPWSEPLPPKVRASAVPQRVDDEAYAPLRKATPANYLFPATLRWLRELPPDVAPHALATGFPRILNLLALQWSDRHRCPAYFDDLLIDRRGGRRGFADVVRREIQTLREFWYAGHA